ncbi:MAG: flavodoxin family protein [Firmicutes bacterium]|nr:flavodoxin family protein [Bacillota bacterium]
MKYAVLYQSDTGNTEAVANEIFDALDSDNKEIINMETGCDIPEADVYFVGFPVHNQTCGLKVMECLDKIERGSVAVFATCGMYPAEKYIEKIEAAVSVWLSDSVEYLGIFVCQGRVTEEKKKEFMEEMPQVAAKLKEMFDIGDSHPDSEDLRKAAVFASNVQNVIN